MSETIPSFALYGEARADSSHIYAHIETIAARSALHDWEIVPHRHTDFVQVLLVESGHVAVTLDGVVSHRDGPVAVIAPPHAVHGFRFSPETQGHVLTLSTDFASRARGVADPLRRLLAQGGIVPLSAHGHEGTLARAMLDQLAASPDDTALHLALAEGLARLIAAHAGPDAAAADDPRLARFRALVERHYREHRALGFYASKLGMTSRTLARLTAARLGASPKQVIDRRLAAEARRLLNYGNASVAQVAAELGFDDPSWFSRFYLRTTGRRPRADRPRALQA